MPFICAEQARDFGGDVDEVARVGICALKPPVVWVAVLAFVLRGCLFK